MKHQHHIKPKHRGGTDDKSNLIELSVTQHAMWHFAEWQLHKNRNDYLAWRAIAGLISCADAVREAQRNGGITTYERSVGIFSEEAKKKTKETQRNLAKQGLHSLQNPEMRAVRAQLDREKQSALWREGKNPLQRADAVQKRREASSTSRSTQNSRQVTCPHCGKTGGQTNMKRYHFDKCSAILTSHLSTI